MREVRNAYKSLVGKLQWRPMRRGEIEVDLEDIKAYTM